MTCLACVGSLALLLVLVPGAAQAVYDPPAEEAAGSAELALEFGEPDPDPDHPDPEDQRVLEDPTDWPWWAWVALLLALVALGVSVALLLMNKVKRVRSSSERDGE